MEQVTLKQFQKTGQAMRDFQDRVNRWVVDCFGEAAADDTVERNHRFIEEALELAQANGATKKECDQLVEYVFGRSKGDVGQEVGGVMLTLAALCTSMRMSMGACGEIELNRVWTKIDMIRKKQAAKPQNSPLPGPTEPAENQQNVSQARGVEKFAGEEIISISLSRRQYQRITQSLQYSHNQLALVGNRAKELHIATEANTRMIELNEITSIIDNHLTIDHGAIRNVEGI